MGLEDDGQPLVGLQHRKRSSGGGDPVAPLRMLHRAGSLAEEASEEVVSVVAPRNEKTLASPPDSERLPARDDLHPRDERARRAIGRLRQQDLHGALEGVLGVVCAERETARRPTKIALGGVEHGERAVTATA